jgi:hypothetical protein
VPSALRIGDRECALDNSETQMLERHLQQLEAKYTAAAMALIGELESAQAKAAYSGGVESDDTHMLEALHAALLAIDRAGGLTRNLNELLVATTVALGV